MADELPIRRLMLAFFGVRETRGSSLIYLTEDLANLHQVELILGELRLRICIKWSSNVHAKLRLKLSITPANTLHFRKRPCGSRVASGSVHCVPALIDGPSTACIYTVNTTCLARISVRHTRKPT